MQEAPVIEETLKELLRTIAYGICKKPQTIHVTYDESMRLLVLQVESGDDQPRLIGRKGIVIWAINAVVWHASQALGRTVRVKLLESIRPATDRPVMPFRAKKDWDRARFQQSVDTTLRCLSSPKWNPQWHFQSDDYGAVELTVEVPESLRESELEQALHEVFHAYGTACGAYVTTKVNWV